MSNPRDVLLSSSYTRTYLLTPIMCQVLKEAFEKRGFKVQTRRVKEGIVLTPPESFATQQQFEEFITFLAYYAKQMLLVQEIVMYEGTE